ncbi:cyclic pyranopterin monophosphate synthase MoaC [Pseudoalteromonas sp. SSM20]|uniref:cyclic pyranopterin monophosphate synthase MoaC n=1 Tax=Pseudoalteromonas sp. SSM20 TaxID=3139394 RepID=UPI003BAA1DDA
MTSFTHVDEQGAASMVDVSEKTPSTRVANAYARISMDQTTFDLLVANANAKGDVLQVARIAGIQAAKRCADLIPLCHPLLLSKVQVDLECDAALCCVHIKAMVKLTGQTGVEMEALTAVNIAALTVFDMCKASDPEMVISHCHVSHKEGGKSGDFSHSQHHALTV